MKKIIILATLLFACFEHIQSQDQDEDRKVDSLKIDSLKRLLPSLKGTDRVDCMQQICLHLGYMAPTGGFKFKKDSIRLFAEQSYKEAKSLDYKQGIALAMLALLPDSSKEKNIREAIKIGEEIKNDKVLGWSYYILGTITDLQTHFHQQEEYFKKAIYHFLKAGDTLWAADANTWLCTEYNYRGDYENAIEYSKRALELCKKKDPAFPSWQKQLVIMASENVAGLYVTAGDYENAIEQLRMASWGPASLAGVFYEMGQYDSTMVYWKRWRNSPYFDTHAEGHKASGYAILAGIYAKNKQYDSAIEIFKRNAEVYKKFNNKYALAREWGYLGKVYNEMGKYDTALLYARKGIREMEKINDRPIMMKNYQVLSSIFHNLGNNDSAYEYLMKYTIIKDSVQSRQFLIRLSNYKREAENAKKEAQIGFLNKDNQIKKQQLKQEATFKKFLIALFIATVFAGLFVFRNQALKRKNDKQAWMVQKLESEKKEAELKRQASDLQMQALRAQMNPHFIFNSLSSINWFIMENDKEKASDYLTRFSRLMRMVLNAQKPAIPLEDELKMLELYLDMERMRLEYSFDYSVTFTNAVDAGTISIPPMLLQPFCENAIWHGFANMTEDRASGKAQGHININIRTEDNLIEFAITDNGIGRKQAEAMSRKPVKKERSRGLSITRERLELFGAEHNAEANFEIQDLTDDNGAASGTKVILTITYLQLIEKIA